MNNSWQEQLKEFYLQGNVCHCLLIYTLFTLVAETGTLQKTLPVLEIDWK